MSIFRRKPKIVGKGTEKTIDLHKEFEVLNCTPVDYKYTTQYADFITHAPEDFKKLISKAAVDDLCDTMMDAYIDARINQMKQSAKEQYTYHMDVIGHHKGLLEGELVRAEGHLLNLEEDLKAIEEEIEHYKKIKKDKCIY